MWHYYSIVIRSTSIDNISDWTATIKGTQFRGMTKILNYLGSLGWELVSMEADRWWNFGSDEGGAVSEYRATFKQPKKTAGDS